MIELYIQSLLAHSSASESITFPEYDAALVALDHNELQTVDFLNSVKIFQVESLG